jgi:hypothetical protein
MMAWTSADVGANELAWLAADKPLFAVQAIPPAPTTVKWVESAQVGAGNIGTWTDRTLAANPTSRAYDWRPDLDTRIDATAAATWYLAMDLGALVEFDCAFLIGHNFGTLSLTTVQIQIADDNAFSGNLTTVADFGSPASDNRLHDLVLGANKRYSARYVWLKLSKGANFTPQLGEIILGRRYQMKTRPSVGFDPDKRHREAVIQKTESGIKQKTVYYSGEFSLDANFVVHEDDRIDDVQSLYDGAETGYVWIWEPHTSPQSWNLMIADDDLDMPSIEWTARSVNLTAVEQGPEAFMLANE